MIQTVPGNIGNTILWWWSKYFLVFLCHVIEVDGGHIKHTLQHCQG